MIELCNIDNLIVFKSSTMFSRLPSHPFEETYRNKSFSLDPNRIDFFVVALAFLFGRKNQNIHQSIRLELDIWNSAKKKTEIKKEWKSFLLCVSLFLFVFTVNISHAIARLPGCFRVCQQWIELPDRFYNNVVLEFHWITCNYSNMVARSLFA